KGRRLWRRPLAQLCLSGSQRELRRLERRCTTTIEKPAPIRTIPTANVQRRARPLDGRGLDLGSFPVDGLVGDFHRSSLLAGVLFSSLDGDVPVPGSDGFSL